MGAVKERKQKIFKKTYKGSDLIISQPGFLVKNKDLKIGNLHICPMYFKNWMYCNNSAF